MLSANQHRVIFFFMYLISGVNISKVLLDLVQLGYNRILNSLLVPYLTRQHLTPSLTLVPILGVLDLNLRINLV